MHRHTIHSPFKEMTIGFDCFLLALRLTHGNEYITLLVINSSSHSTLASVMADATASLDPEVLQALLKARDEELVRVQKRLKDALVGDDAIMGYR